MNKLKLDTQKINDMLSALSFFAKEYPDKRGSLASRKNMKKISVELWKLLKKSQR
jgi:hypothetical protein